MSRNARGANVMQDHDDNIDDEIDEDDEDDDDIDVDDEDMEMDVVVSDVELDDDDEDDDDDDEDDDEDGMIDGSRPYNTRLRAQRNQSSSSNGNSRTNNAGGSSGSTNNNNNNSSTNASSNNEPVEEDAALVRRRAIQAIMRDTTLSEADKRMQIQNLMSGGRTSVAAPPAPILPSQQAQQGGVAGGGDPNGSIDANAACVHYERNCNIVAPCCQRIYGCRICHDELSAPTHPDMNRFMVREVVCKNCHTRQAVSNQCVSCHTIFGEYHCGICNLWMSMPKKPFHCDKCGFCRVGGADAFRHCDECCMCISVSVFETHQCFKDKYKNNCPVCREDMFSSRQSPQDLPCGHAIHAHCFRKLAGFDYRCPICKKTVVSQQSMAAAWEARARDIAEHPMPSDLQRVVDIMCNDCETKSHSLQWHFLGIQCPSCSSFNTVVEQVLSSGPQPPPTTGTGTTPNGPSNDPSSQPPPQPPAPSF